MAQRTSLKQRLLFLSLAAITLVWLGAAAFTYDEAREEFDEMLDAHLVQAAALLTVQAMHEIEELETEHTPLLHKYARRVAFQVWDKERKLRLHSVNAPQEPLASRERGFSDNVINGYRWRVFSTRDESGDYLIQVAERAEVREELARDIAGNLLRPLALSLPLLAVMLWIAVTRGLRPLNKLAHDVERRDPANLSALDSSAAPRETIPLIERLNRLFIRIEASLQKERQFTADAAHELRTPIASIKAQAQVARAATGDAERTRALDNAILGCDRAAHLIEQLLTLARVDTLERSTAEACRLREIAAETIAALAPGALQKGVQLEFLAGDDISVQGNSGLLSILLQNLLDNAVKHTPHGTLVQVGITRDHESVSLSVCDNGQGLPEQELAKVRRRFYRPLGTRAGGSGLGLSIVQRIAEVHHATLQLASGSEGWGLKVTVRFKA